MQIFLASSKIHKKLVYPYIYLPFYFDSSFPQDLTCILFLLLCTWLDPLRRNFSSGCTCTKTVLCGLQPRTIRRKKGTWRTPLFIWPTMLSIEAMRKIKRKKASFFTWTLDEYFKATSFILRNWFWSIRFIKKQIYLNRKLKSFSCDVLRHEKNNFYGNFSKRNLLVS